jgi:hypothetical protein
VRFVVGGIAKYPDGKYAHGSAIPFAWGWLDSNREWMTKVKAAAPDVVALAYFHGQISTEQSAAVKYRDARLTGSNGEHIHYPYRYALPQFLPTRENTYGKALSAALDVLIARTNTGGIYWDEMSYSVLRYAHNAPWDGVSVRINPKTHAVEGKVSNVTLLTQALWLDLIQRIREKGLRLIANTMPFTRTMQQERFVRFVETGSYSALAMAHLFSPVGLGNHHPEKSDADAARNVREMLQWGAVYYGHTARGDAPDWSFTEPMFPITPEEIGPGYVLGRERIHTAISGRFGWNDGATADVYVVDAAGKRVDKFVKAVTSPQGVLYEVRMPSDHFAILVKRASRN